MFRGNGRAFINKAHFYLFPSVEISFNVVNVKDMFLGRNLSWNRSGEAKAGTASLLDTLRLKHCCV